MASLKYWNGLEWVVIGGSVDGKVITDVQIWDDGMVITFDDASTLDYDFITDVEGKITTVTNNTDMVSFDITWNGGSKP